jgi:hypothetical protein
MLYAPLLLMGSGSLCVEVERGALLVLEWICSGVDTVCVGMSRTGIGLARSNSLDMCRYG